MISTKVRALVSSFRGEPLLAVNMCAHCALVDDPESASRWPDDEDGDRVCPECGAADLRRTNEKKPATSSASSGREQVTGGGANDCTQTKDE